MGHCAAAAHEVSERYKAEESARQHLGATGTDETRRDLETLAVLTQALDQQWAFLERQLEETIFKLRLAGVDRESIADVIGMTNSAAHEKYAKKVQARIEHLINEEV